MNNSILIIGFYYFGARYYNSDLSIWLSVDPMSDMYPSTSPFAYVENNPIMFVDPNGMFKTEFRAKVYKFFHGGEVKQNSQNDQWYVEKVLKGGEIKAPKDTKDSEGVVTSTGLSGVELGFQIKYSWGKESKRKRGGERMLGNNSQQDESIPSGDPGHNKGFIDVSYVGHPNAIANLILNLIEYFDFRIERPNNIPSPQKTEKSTSNSVPDKLLPQSMKQSGLDPNEIVQIPIPNGKVKQGNSNTYFSTSGKRKDSTNISNSYKINE